VMLVYLPNHRAIAETRREIETKRQNVAQGVVRAATLAAVKKDLARAKERIAAWDATTTDTRQMALLFGKINALVKSSGAVTVRFDPEQELRRQRIVEIPLALGITGTFAQIQQFLWSLESLPTTIWIESLKMVAAGKDGGFVQADIKLVVFTVNPENSDYVKYSAQPIN
jgi:Tfp pilus assembly protein PilO